MNKTKHIKLVFISLFIILFFPPLSKAEKKQFNFSWQFNENSELKPRGGSSKGAPITLDPSPNPGWLSIQDKDITKFEKDRRAILSLAGTYRTSFNFIETIPLKKDYKIDRPYQSWATEHIEVIEDKNDFISLQHILVMFLLDEDGKTIGPFTSKHWRQDWKYEDTSLLLYKGKSKWKKQTIENKYAKGKWTQAVYQVDDSPRYESIGKWEHKDNYSSWTGSEVWRPLPRREFSVRKDYDVLSGINTNVITPNGWVHEQQNLKLVLDKNGNQVDSSPYIAKEIGINRYERIINNDYKDGEDYLTATGDFWQIVRENWNKVFQTYDSFEIKSRHKDKKLFEYLFKYADDLREKRNFNREKAKKFVRKTIDSFVEKGKSDSKNNKYH